MAGFIDADAHVDECVDTWEYMDPEDLRYKPVYLDPPGPGYLVHDSRPHPLWLVGGNVRLKRYRDDRLTGTRLVGLGIVFAGSALFLWYRDRAIVREVRRDLGPPEKP